MINKTLKLIEQVYPKYLVLLVLIPVFVGYIIDFEVSDKYGVFSNLLWIPIATIPYYLTKKNIFYQIIVIFYFIVGVLEITHWLILKGPLSVASLLAVSNTNITEASEFVGVQAISLLLFLIPFTILFYLSLINVPKKYSSKYKFFLIGLVLFIIGLISFSPFPEFLVKGTPQFVKVSKSYVFNLQKYYKAVENNKLKEVDTQFDSNIDQQLFVLIIGESASRNHMSLYKYRKKTNPKLEKRKDIFVFDNVVSSYSNTIETVMSMLTESNIENKKPFYKSKDLIDVFHSTGFKTYWISNQPPLGWAENLISSIGAKADNTKFVNVLNNSSYESDLKSSLDEKIFEPFSSALDDNNVTKKLIILHLMGNHLLYNKRYPKKYNVFKGKIEKQQMIAEYDNSILYNDFVIDSLFKMIELNSKKNTKQIASAIYLSDHGENVYDELDLLGHHAVKSFPKANVEIPFLVWLSPSFIASDSTKFNTIKSNIHKPYISDDLFHSILDLNNIETSLLEKQRSLFHENFNDKRIRILSDGMDYDNK